MKFWCVLYKLSDFGRFGGLCDGKHRPAMIYI